MIKKNPEINFICKTECDKAVISGDPYLLYSCLTNLINNAMDAISLTNRKGEIKVKVYTEKLHIFVSVTDNDCGMDLNKSDLKQRIFMPFFQQKPSWVTKKDLIPD